MIWGKLLGAIFGFFAAGPFGAVMGLVIGHFFDKGLAGLQGGMRPDPEAEHVFFATVFTLMGQLAKADGRVSEAEIDGAETLMAELGLSAELRREAIDLFKRGAAPDFDMEPQLAKFLRHCAVHPGLRNLLFEYLVALALADGVLDAAEQELLRRISGHLGFHPAQFEQLLAMLRAQQRFYQRAGGAQQAPQSDALADAYRALGVEPDADDRAVKAAFRRLMSQHHPDKLIAQGVPEEMVKMATAKTQEIQAAYALIERARQS